eukprot:PhF_6_TR6200/c0_g1_i1/m.9323
MNRNTINIRDFPFLKPSPTNPNVVICVVCNEEMVPDATVVKRHASLSSHKKKETGETSFFVYHPTLSPVLPVHVFENTWTWADVFPVVKALIPYSFLRETIQSLADTSMEERYSVTTHNVVPMPQRRRVTFRQDQNVLEAVVEVLGGSSHARCAAGTLGLVASLVLLPESKAFEVHTIKHIDRPQHLKSFLPAIQALGLNPIGMHVLTAAVPPNPSTGFGPYCCFTVRQEAGLLRTHVLSLQHKDNLHVTKIEWNKEETEKRNSLLPICSVTSSSSGDLDVQFVSWEDIYFDPDGLQIGNGESEKGGGGVTPLDGMCWNPRQSL